MDKVQLQHEIYDRHGEYLEMEEDPSLMLIDILMNMVLKERETATYYKRRLNHATANGRMA